MSTDTPAPERVTLTEGEMKELLTASTWDGDKCEHVDAEGLTAAVEMILAAREQALREEIAGEIEADYPDKYEIGYVANRRAARIARGGAR